jgi:O-antigen/teichoic acid export membrane protein
VNTESIASAEAVICPPPAKTLAWRIFKNASSQMAGRLVIAVARLIIAGLIIRGFGRTVFGQYSIIFGLLSIAEWICDFGTTEVAVREICRDRTQQSHILGVLRWAKLLQVPAGMAVLISIAFALRYPAEIQRSVWIGALSLIFFGGILVYRALFKANMTMEREVGGELTSLIAAIPLVALAGYEKLGLPALIACHVFSRVVFLAACAYLGRGEAQPIPAGGRRSDVSHLLRSSAAIGFIGFLVGNYETMDVVLLSKLSSFSELALYSAAQRLLWPSLIAFSSIAATVYPVAASNWPHSPAEFLNTCQKAVDAVVLLAGVLLTAMLAAPEFFLGLLGRDLLPAAPILRILAFLCFVKAITGTIGPMLYIIHAQRRMLYFIVVALVVKLGVLALLAARYGALGAACGALAVELFFATIPASVVFARASGHSLNWTVPAKTLGAAVGVAFLVRSGFSSGGIATAATAICLYLPIVFVLGAVKPMEIQWLLRWRRA